MRLLPQLPQLLTARRRPFRGKLFLTRQRRGDGSLLPPKRRHRAFTDIEPTERRALILRQITDKAGGPVSYALAIPKKKDEKSPEKPLPSVNQYDSRWVALDVEGFKPFETFEIAGRTLDKNKELIQETKYDKLSKLEVYLSRAFTAKPGTVEITFP